MTLICTAVLPHSHPVALGIVEISKSKQHALMACFHAGGLYRRQGWWYGKPCDAKISGVTVATLERDGMFVKTDARAVLTEDGLILCKTLAEG